MGFLDFFKKNKEEIENEIKTEKVVEYTEQIERLHSKGMPLDQILVKFSTIKDFPVDSMLNDLSTNSIKEDDKRIFEFNDGSKIVRTESGIHAIRKSKEPESIKANEINQIVEKTKNKKEAPKEELSVLEKLRTEENPFPELDKIETPKEEVKEEIKEEMEIVKIEPKKRRANFSMR